VATVLNGVGAKLYNNIRLAKYPKIRFADDNYPIVHFCSNSAVVNVNNMTNYFLLAVTFVV